MQENAIEYSREVHVYKKALEMLIVDTPAGAEAMCTLRT